MSKWAMGKWKVEKRREFFIKMKKCFGRRRCNIDCINVIHSYRRLLFSHHVKSINFFLRLILFRSIDSFHIWPFQFSLFSRLFFLTILSSVDVASWPISALFIRIQKAYLFLGTFWFSFMRKSYVYWKIVRATEEKIKNKKYIFFPNNP